MRPRLRRRTGGFPRPLHVQRAVPCQCRHRTLWQPQECPYRSV